MKRSEIALPLEITDADQRDGADDALRRVVRVLSAELLDVCVQNAMLRNAIRAGIHDEEAPADLAQPVAESNGHVHWEG